MTSSKEPVQVWKSSDGRVHDTLGDARTREYQLTAIQEITKILTDTEEVLVAHKLANQLAEYLTTSNDGLRIAAIITALEE